MRPSLIAGIMRESGRQGEGFGAGEGWQWGELSFPGEPFSASLLWTPAVRQLSSETQIMSSKPGAFRSSVTIANCPLPGNRPPAMIPRKAQYLRSDVKLQGQHFQVPIQFPKDFFGVILEKGEEGAGEVDWESS